jgi:dihydroorotate dehydrogenase (NAD+) catalytic subunit
VKRKHSVITSRAAAARNPKAPPPPPPVIPSSARRLPGETFSKAPRVPAAPPPPPVAAAAPEPVAGRRVDLAADLAPRRDGALLLDNPLLAAAGTFGYGLEYADVVDVQGLGAICCKGTTLKPRRGNPPPRMIETPAGLLGSVGLQNPGVDAVLERYAPIWAAWDVPVIVSVAGESVEEYAAVARRLDGQPGVAAVELDLACPDLGRGLPLALDADAVSSVTRAVRGATGLPLLVKLSPAVADVRRVARAVAGAGGDAITVAGALPGLAIDRVRRRPVLGGIQGGVSGPALKPVALRLVYEAAHAVDLPIVGVGGVTCLDDVLDLLMAGASAVGVGTAVLADPGLPLRLVDELEAWCVANGLASHRDIVGAALPRRRDRPGGRAGGVSPR